MIKDALEYLFGAGASLNSGASIEKQNAAKGTVPVVTIEDNMSIKSIETYLPAPVRARGTAVALSSDAFVALWKRLHAADSVITAKEYSFEAVFNYEKKGSPSWGDHRVTFVPKFSSIWKRIKENCGYEFDQIMFAEFVEEADNYIKDSAKFMEVAQKMRATKKVEYENVNHLASGSVDLVFKSLVDGLVGTQKVPQEITFRCPIYENEQEVDVTGKFRFRLSGGRLTLFFVIFQIEDMEKEAFKLIAERISDETKTEIIDAKV